jgi:hypothetical protein
MKICPNCSFENVEGYMFCEDCGEDITHVESKHAKPGFVIQLHRLTTLGRYDEDRPQQPDIDLTMYNALEKGVSSLHASIEHSRDGVWLQDAGSTNGTYLNGRRLIANQNYIVRDGDEIRLGRLVTNIQFQGDI